MPRLCQYIGKQTEKSENYFQTNVTFGDLVNNQRWIIYENQITKVTFRR